MLPAGCVRLEGAEQSPFRPAVAAEQAEAATERYHQSAQFPAQAVPHLAPARETSCTRSQA